jgi:hypothetical protein
MADEEKVNWAICPLAPEFYGFFRGLGHSGLTEQQINAGGPTTICPAA